jgi:hypothetical protein
MPSLIIRPQNPLMWCAFKGKDHCIKVLLANGADVDAINTSPHENKLSALHYALKRSEANPNSVRLLLEAGANIEYVNGEGNNAEKLAETNEEYKKILSEYKDKPKNKKGALGPAAQRGMCDSLCIIA